MWNVSTDQWNRSCDSSLSYCNKTQIAILRKFRSAYLDILKEATQPTKGGPLRSAFITSCLTHCETASDGWQVRKIGGVTEGEAVAAFVQDPTGASAEPRVMCDWPCEEAGSTCGPHG